MSLDLEKIADFITNTEKALSGFALDAMAMRGRLPTLRNLIGLLTEAMMETRNEDILAILTNLETRAQNCSDCIRHRLLIKC